MFQAILCGVEKMPGQKCPSVCLGISSAPHKMAWNILWHRLWNILFYVVCLAPKCTNTWLERNVVERERKKVVIRIVCPPLELC